MLPIKLTGQRANLKKQGRIHCIHLVLEDNSADDNSHDRRDGPNETHRRNDGSCILDAPGGLSGEDAAAALERLAQERRYARDVY